MKTFAVAALLVAATQAGPAFKANKICIDNEAGFVLDFYMHDIKIDKKSDTSEKYPIAKKHCMTIGDHIKDAKDGDVIQTHVKAIAGKTNKVGSDVIY